MSTATVMQQGQSEAWSRVAGLKPRLRSHVRIQRQLFRGELWYVIQDAVTGRFHRFSPQAYGVIGLMDGRRSMDDIWQRISQQPDASDQDELIALLAQLHQAEVIQAHRRPDIADLQKRARQRRRTQLHNRLKTPLAIRIPLVDPDRFLQATLPLVQPLLGRTALWLWLFIVISALLQVPLHWQALAQNVSDQIFSLENLLLIGLIYPLVKLLHEFAHAYTIKRFGGEVHEMGVMFLVFMPFPYVDATAATAFTDKRQRMLVGAVGIMMELLLASLAMWLWLYAEPGPLRALMFNVMFIAGVSSLLFNGNPLLRYDAYYVLADYLELPNMAQRANRAIGHVLKKYLLQVKGERAEEDRRVLAILCAYGVASFVYRVFLTLSIALFVASTYFFIGVLLAMWSLWSTLVMPALRVLRVMWTNQTLRAYRGRFALAAGLFAGCVLLVLLVIPFPYATTTEGVVWLDDSAKLRAAVSGQVVEVLAQPGETVDAGTVLVRSQAPELDIQIRVLQAQLAEFEAKRQASRFRDRTAARIFSEEIARIQNELQEARRQAAALTLRSPAAGVFLMPDNLDLPGRYRARGEVLAYVVNPARLSVRGLVPQEAIDRVRNDVQDIRLRFASSPGVEQTAHISQLVPAASHALPSLALGVEGGGRIALDPGAYDEPRAYARYYPFELVSDTSLPIERIGERVYVRFVHHAEPLGFRLFRQVRRVFLRRLDV